MNAAEIISAHALGRSLAGARIENCDLRGRRLDGIDLSQAKLSNVAFDGASLLRCRLQKCDAKEASFRGATLDHAGVAAQDLDADVRIQEFHSSTGRPAVRAA